MVIHNTFADFVLFLYIHMAYADGFFHHTEKELILEKMTKLFPNETDHRTKLERAEKDYLHLGTDKVSIIIFDSFKHFNQVKFAQKYKVYTDMFDIVHADGKVDESETEALDALKKIIDMSAEAKH
jgi:uncharacterized tellurite resistance protein B-like protein